MLGSGLVDTLFIVGDRVGIGTIGPQRQLHVAGNGLVNNVFLGDVGHGGSWAGFSHGNSVGPDRYGLLQSGDGLVTLINKRPGGGHIGFRVGNNDRVIIDDAGNVGIGGWPDARLRLYGGDLRLDAGRTISAPGRLHITGDEILYVLNRAGMVLGREWGGTGNLVVQGLLGVNGQPASPRTPGWGGGIRTWDLEAEGSAWCRNGWQSGPRDLAENFQSDETLAPGEIVCFHPERDAVVRSAQPNDPLVCGVVSTAPGVLLNSDPDAAGRDKLVPVALCGRVPCRVVDENGPIRRGDLLTSSSTPGHAMRADAVRGDARQTYQPGTILGKALEVLAGGSGVIEVFVTSA